MLGLGFGAGTALDRYNQMRDQRLAKEYGMRVNNIIGKPARSYNLMDDESFGPSDPIHNQQGLMSNGTGLLGGEITPWEAIGQLEQIPGYQGIAGKVLQDQMQPRNPPAPIYRPLPVPGPKGDYTWEQMHQLLPNGQQIPIGHPGPMKVPTTNIKLPETAVDPSKVFINKIDDLKEFTNKDGENPPASMLGSTPAAIEAAGYHLRSTAAQKQEMAKSQANDIVDTMEQMFLGNPDMDENGMPVTGTGGLLNDYGLPDQWGDQLPDWARPYGDQAAQIIKGNLKPFDPTDPRYTTAKDFLESTLSPLARSMGEVGALAEGDVDRATGFQIRMGGLRPDTPAAARQKLNNIRGILNKGEQFLKSKKPGDTWTRQVKGKTVYYRMTNERNPDGSYVIEIGEEYAD